MLSRSINKLLCIFSGSTGTKVELKANYFELLNVPGWALYQYRVDFSPEEDQTHMKKKLIREHQEVFGPHPYIFDGTTLLTVVRLQTEVSEINTIWLTWGG